MTKMEYLKSDLSSTGNNLKIGKIYEMIVFKTLDLTQWETINETGKQQN